MERLARIAFPFFSTFLIKKSFGKFTVYL